MLRLFGYGPRNRRRPLENKPRINLLLGVLAALLLLLPLSYLVNLESKQAETVVESHRFVPKDASAAMGSPAKPSAKRAPAPKPKKPQLKLKEGKLKRGESIIVALKKSGASSREAHSVSKAAAGLLDMRCLKPGGIAVHTTEFNCSSNDATLTEGGTVLFRRRDFEEIAKRLRADGHQIDLDFTAGSLPADRHVDLPPYEQNVHLKLMYDQYVISSFGIVVQAAS